MEERASDPFFTMSMCIPPPPDCAVHFSIGGHTRSMCASDIFIYTPPPLSDVQLRMDVVFMIVSIASEETARESAPPHNSAEQSSIVSEERLTVGVRGRVEGEETVRESAPPDELDEQLSKEIDSKERREEEETVRETPPPVSDEVQFVMFVEDTEREDEQFTSR